MEPPAKRTRYSVRQSRLPPVPPLPSDTTPSTSSDKGTCEASSSSARVRHSETESLELQSSSSVSLHLSREEKLVYYANFLFRHGATRALLAGMEDFLSIITERNTLSVELEEMMGSMVLKYALRTFRYCQECDSYLKSGTEVCRNTNCSLVNVPCKPSRTQCRSAIYTVRIRLQLELILRNVLHHLVVLHSELHLDVRGDRNRCRETTDFAAYKEEIGTLEDFVSFEMKVVLTMNFDGVRLKKLSRSEMWPVHMRLEGLPFKEENKYENNILVALLISRKPRR